MDSDGLPIVGDGIDFTKVGAIHQKRTLAFLNHFISHTVRFLNRFSNVCEEKLEDLTYRLQRIEITMNILEAKLNSVAGLEDVTVPSSAPPAAAAGESPAAVSAPPSSSGQQPPSAPPPPPLPADGGAPVPPAEPPAEPPAPSGPTVAQDPRYKKYFTMLNMGVPVPAIQQKMQVEGCDPQLLNTPDAPAPPSGPAGNDSDSDDFSSDSD